MSGSLNCVHLIGNVGKDPEIRHTQDGKPIANLSIATSETWRDKSTGEKRESTQWHRIVCFNEHITRVIEAYVKKGAKVYVCGQLQTREYTDQAGVKKYSTEVVLQNFRGELTLLDSKGSDERGSSPYPEVGSERDPNAPPREGSRPMRDALSDDVPFAPQVL